MDSTLHRGKLGKLGCVVLQKRQSRHRAVERANVYNRDRHKDQQMGNKSVDARSNVDVLSRHSFPDFPRSPQILMEIMSADSPRSFFPVGQDREDIAKGDSESRPGVHAPVQAHAFQERWDTAHSFGRDFRIEPREVLVML